MKTSRILKVSERSSTFVQDIATSVFGSFAASRFNEFNLAQGYYNTALFALFIVAVVVCPLLRSLIAAYRGFTNTGVIVKN